MASLSLLADGLGILDATTRIAKRFRAGVATQFAAVSLKEVVVPSLIPTTFRSGPVVTFGAEFIESYRITRLQKAAQLCGKTTFAAIDQGLVGGFAITGGFMIGLLFLYASIRLYERDGSPKE